MRGRAGLLSRPDASPLVRENAGTIAHARPGAKHFRACERDSAGRRPARQFHAGEGCRSSIIESNPEARARSGAASKCPARPATRRPSASAPPRAAPL